MLNRDLRNILDWGIGMAADDFVVGRIASEGLLISTVKRILERESVAFDDVRIESDADYRYVVVMRQTPEGEREVIRVSFQ